VSFSVFFFFHIYTHEKNNKKTEQNEKENLMIMISIFFSLFTIYIDVKQRPKKGEKTNETMSLKKPKKNIFLEIRFGHC